MLPRFHLKAKKTCYQSTCTKNPPSYSHSASILPFLLGNSNAWHITMAFNQSHHSLQTTKFKTFDQQWRLYSLLLDLTLMSSDHAQQTKNVVGHELTLDFLMDVLLVNCQYSDHTQDTPQSKTFAWSSVKSNWHACKSLFCNAMIYENTTKALPEN